MPSSRISLVGAAALAAQCSCSLAASWFGSEELPVFAAESPQLAFDGPFIVNIGPVVDPVDEMLVPRGFTGFPIEEFVGEAPFELGSGGFEDLSMLLGGFRGMEDVINGDHFDASTKDGHFKLRASLPGFNIQSDTAGSETVDQPLSVEIIGRSLVVRGQKSDEQSMTSFQRSFQLPRAADADKISVTYSKCDGALAVDVPAKDGMPENVAETDDDEWMFNTEEAGSHTSITFSSGPGGGAQKQPPRQAALRGGPRKPAEDPFLQLIEMLTGATAREFDDSGGAPASGIFAVPVEDSPELPLIEMMLGAPDEGEDSPAVPLIPLMLGAPDEGEDTGPPLAAPLPEPVAVAKAVPTVMPAKPAYMAQPKNSWPFWRLGADASVVEVVAPAGTDLGKPEGNRVPIHTRGEKAVVGHVDLPVSVLQENCSWAAEQGSWPTEQALAQERVLRCRMESDAVRRVRIKDAAEL